MHKQFDVVNVMQSTKVNELFSDLLCDSVDGTIKKPSDVRAAVSAALQAGGQLFNVSAGPEDLGLATKTQKKKLQ